MSTNIKIITDEPTLEDALDFRNYARTLADIILNSTPRFTVGIFGGWGTGKTSLMLMIKELLDGYPHIITVWFDAWRYEREENLAVIPFLRTLKLTLDASEKSREGKWQGVKNGVKRSAIAFLKSSKVTYGVPGVATAETDFASVADSLKGDGSVADDRNVIYYYGTAFLERALTDLRKEDKDKDHRIVVFIDDLDRCSPERALEVLESIKSFFDIEGIVYVVGMDSKTINSLIIKKFGQDSPVKGLDYLQKIVQLPFQIPTWREADISASIEKIIQEGLAGSDIIREFTNKRNLYLIVKAIELNPREVKRFINTIILVKSVFDKPIYQLIVVQALNFRTSWNRFLELISVDKTRKTFLRIYRELRKQNKKISNEEELAKYSRENNIPVNVKEAFEISEEISKQGSSLTAFLDAGALDILETIDHIEEYQRVLDAARVKEIKFEEEREKDRERKKEHELLWSLAKAGKIEEFNAKRPPYEYIPGMDFTNADLSGIDLSRTSLSYGRMSGANLSGANLSFVTSFVELECEKANFSGAVITNTKFAKYLQDHGALNVSVTPNRTKSS